MIKVVFATNPADRFHETRDCANLVSAQNQADNICGCGDYCTHHMPRAHPVLRMELDRALRNGKRPCIYCYPDPVLRGAMLPPSREDFGHRPAGFTGREFCARCTVDVGIRGLSGKPAQISVPWPCTSAIIYGLVPRETV